ncbi:hypothetical protein GQ44DRAFT_718192 [Phaeosphaeriaceae sp. PMI808]|nr:hypothetical protein GQ44DRAFT_718192 [Phaeosphaeriaceae sp. PMI808]
MRARRAIQMLAKPYQELRKLTNFSPLATNVVETYIFGLSWAFDISLKDINALVCRELPELAGGPEAFYDEQISSSEPLKDGLHYIKTLEEAGGDSSRVFFAFWNAVGFPTLDSYQWYHKLTALGLGPKGLRAGDMVVVLFGCDNPVVLRRIENNFRLVGAVYIQRISEGQAMEDLTDGGYERQTFEIQ